MEDSGQGHERAGGVATPSGDSRTAQAFARFIENDPMVDVDGRQERKHENLVYTEWPEGSGYYILMPPDIRTMAISFDNARIKEECRNAAPSTIPIGTPGSSIRASPSRRRP